MERQDVRININKDLGHKFVRLEVLVNCGYDRHRIADLPVCIEQSIQSFYGFGGYLQVTQGISCTESSTVHRMRERKTITSKKRKILREQYQG